MEKYKSKIYLLIFLITSGILAWGAWRNYKPQVIYASCADIAQKTSNLTKRTEIFNTSDGGFNQNLNDCLKNVGYYK
jgi:hypothetical protein